MRYINKTNQSITVLKGRKFNGTRIHLHFWVNSKQTTIKHKEDTKYKLISLTEDVTTIFNRFGSNFNRILMKLGKSLFLYYSKLLNLK